jgi:chitin-binding protein
MKLDKHTYQRLRETIDHHRRTQSRAINRAICLGALYLLTATHSDLSAHGLIMDPPARNWFCGALTKPHEIMNGTAQFPACGDAFNAPGMDPNAGYNFMSVLTHTKGYGVVGARANVCGYDSETWKGGPTVWDQPIDWPTNRMSSGPKTFTWNISWGPHFSDTQEFRYWITKADFKHQIGKPLAFSDFEDQPFCSLTYSDANPTANPAVIARSENSTFMTHCTLPNRTGRHVIYAEWGRNFWTYERFHGCVDALFDYNAPTQPVDANLITTPQVSEITGQASLLLDGSPSQGNGLNYRWSVDAVQPALYQLENDRQKVATLRYLNPPTQGSLKVTLTVSDGVSTNTETLTLIHKPALSSAWLDLGELAALAQPLRIGDGIALRTVTGSGIDAYWPIQPVILKNTNNWILRLAQAINGQNGPVRIGALDGQGNIGPSQQQLSNRIYVMPGSGIKNAFLKVIPAPDTATPANVTPMVVNSSPWYFESQVRLRHTQPITSLKLTITLKKTGGWTLNGLYNTVGSKIRQSAQNTAQALTYEFELFPGQILEPAQSRIFAAQVNGSGKTRPTTGDGYRISYTMGGVTYSNSGQF